MYIPSASPPDVSVTVGGDWRLVEAQSTRFSRIGPQNYNRCFIPCCPMLPSSPRLNEPAEPGTALYMSAAQMRTSRTYHCIRLSVRGTQTAKKRIYVTLYAGENTLCTNLATMLTVPFCDAVLSAVACGLTTHLMFNKLETDFLKLLVCSTLIMPLLPAVLLLSHYSSPVVAVFVAYSTSYATLVVSVLCYRISSFHPLSKYPGPAFARMSKMWAIYQTYSGKNHVTFLNLHRRYGPVVRTGPNELSICDATIHNQILGAQGMPKGPLWDGRQSPKAKAFALIADRDNSSHLRRRRVWNKALNTSQVKAYEPILQKRIDQLLEELKRSSNNNSPVDLAEWFSFFSYDFMGDMAFGGGFELMRERDANGLWKLMEDGLRVPAYAQHVPWASPFLYSLPGIGQQADKLRNFVIQTATKRLKRGVALAGQDLSSYLLDEGSPSPKPPAVWEYVADSFLAVIAGSDTSAIVLSCLFFHILSDRTIFDRLRNETDEAFPRNGDQSPADNTSRLAGMPLLNAVINEALRLQPPLPTGLQRAPAVGGGGKIVGSIFVPEGTNVYVPPYAIHRDPRYFSPDPDRFWPERWLEDHNSPVLVTTDRSAFLPYSAGPMNCAGKQLAQLELRLVVATFVQQLDMDLEPGWDHAEWELGLKDLFVFKKGVLPVVIKARASE
ncbi:cytochrome P450 [Mycena epipterygia]|nr:cytochrome P450 [Mycena epipterygia]